MLPRNRLKLIVVSHVGMFAEFLISKMVDAGSSGVNRTLPDVHRRGANDARRSGGWWRRDRR